MFPGAAKPLVSASPADKQSAASTYSASVLQDAIRASLAILEIAADQVTVPLLGAVYRAPVPLPTDCSAWLHGQGGTFKTSLCALARQHFGESMGEGALPGNWRWAQLVAHRDPVAYQVLAGAAGLPQRDGGRAVWDQGPQPGPIGAQDIGQHLRAGAGRPCCPPAPTATASSSPDAG